MEDEVGLVILERDSRFRWARDVERIRLRVVNLPVVKLCVWQTLFGLHGHVQNAWRGFGRHDDARRSQFDVQVHLKPLRYAQLLLQILGGSRVFRRKLEQLRLTTSEIPKSTLSRNLELSPMTSAGRH